MATMAILGGTGPEGRGLALRFALAGENVIIGSRDARRAAEAAAKIRERLGARSTARIASAENADAAAGADCVVLAVPFAGIETLLPSIAAALAGKIVLDVVNPIELRDGTFQLTPVAEGSAGQRIQRLAPAARVVSGLKNLSHERLQDIGKPLCGDALLCGDHPDATQACIDLIARIPDLRPIDAGALANAHALESVTALLLNVNRRYRAVTSIRILGLP